MNLIKVKIPTSAPFIPTVVGDYTLLGGYYEWRDYYFSTEEIWNKSFHKGHTVRKSVERPLTECFENRIIPIDEIFDNGVSVTYSLGYIDSHQYRPVIMQLRDYYDYLYEVYSLWYQDCGFTKSELIDMWSTYSDIFSDGYHFNHIVKRNDYNNRPYLYKLEKLITGFVRSNRYKITDDIKITVSPCR